MAKNPMKAAMMDEPHHRAKGMKSHPMEKHKHAHNGLRQVPMGRGHGARASAKGRDHHRASDLHPKLPGVAEPSGIQPAVKGSMRFGNQGL